MATSIDGRYRIDSELGRGAMGRVFRVTDSYAGGVPLACKVLEDPQLEERFFAEFRLLRRLAHPGFVSAYDLGIDCQSARPYATLELAQGRALNEPSAELDGADPVELSAALLRAIDHLHRLGYAHGDLAPANVLVGPAPANRVKVLDLGAAGEIGSGGGSTSGVLRYVSPERLAGAPLSPAADLWSIGVLLFELVHSRHPLPEYPARKPDDGPPSRAGLEPSPLDPLLDRLLANSPEKRYPSASAALEELASLTERSLPLVPAEELAARSRSVPFIDAGGYLASVERILDDAIAAQRPKTVEIGGPSQCGRSRLLREIAHRLAARGVPVALESGLAGGPPGAPLMRAMQRLGVPAGELSVDRPAAFVQQVLSAARRQDAPLAIVLDDFDRADALTREAIEGLARNIYALPDRIGALLVVTAGGSWDFELKAWRTDDLDTLLTELFPGRRVGARVAGPIGDVARGNIGLSLEILHAMGESGALCVDAAAVQISNEGLERLELPASLEDAAEVAVGRLEPGLRDSAALLAFAREPLPVGMLDGREADLVDAGVAAWATAGNAGDGPWVTMGSDPLVRAGRTLKSAAEAHSELARRWTSLAGELYRGQSLWHQIAADEEGAVERASAALSQLPKRAAAVLLEPLIERGWPADAESACAGADAAAASGRAELGVKLYKRAAELAADDSTAARALSRLGALEARQARHAAALKALSAALERGEECLELAQRAEILAGLARSAVLSGDLEQAEAWSAEGLGIVGNQRHTRGRLNYTRGLVAWYRGELDAAAKAFNRALDDVRSVGDLVEQGAVVTAQGLVAHRRGKLELALKHYERALKLGEQAGDDARVVTALQNLGVVHHERRAWAQALDTYREALGLAEALNQTGRVVQLAGNLGNLWRYLGELPEARSTLERGLALAEQEGNRYMMGVILTLLGEVALADESWDEAERFFQDALKATVDTQSATEEVEVWLDLAKLHLERQDYLQVRKASTAAGKSAEKMGNQALMTQATALMAAAHRRSIHGSDNEASRMIAAAVQNLESITNPDEQWPVILEAAFDARQRGDLDEAQAYAAQVRQILQQLEDAVPADHRTAFRALRERRRAWFDTAMAEQPLSASPRALSGDDGRWTRLLEINKRLNTEFDIKRLLEYIMDSAILLTGAERGFLLLAEEAAKPDKRLRIRVARNIDQENIRNVRFKISRSIAQRVIDQGEPVLTVDAMEDSRYSEQLSVHDLRLRSVLCLPMRSRGQVLGAIYLDNRFRKAAFGDEELAFMEAFADQAGIALNNARLVRSMEDSRGELEQAREKVEQLNAQLQGELQRRTEELADSHRVVIRQQRQLEAQHQYSSIIGNSEAMRAVFAIMDRLLENTIPVLIEGESGTGKELVARAIHYNGARHEEPFVAVNCGAIPANLLESELFGHVRGAFTGATGDKKGLFEAAHRGTLLLDELGELPLEMQVKLLRVLQNGEIKKVGSAKEIKVDVRIVAATNRRLDEEVAGGRFREDLYYRLSVVPIHIPPLRERRDDIPLLVQHFVRQNREAALGPVTAIAPRALALLQRYSWPGNVRQLEMVLKNASLFAESEILDSQDFQAFPDIVGTDRAPLTRARLSGRTLSDIEREAIIQALEDNRGNKKRSAEQLGIDRRTLYNKLKAYNIVIEKELKVT